MSGSSVALDKLFYSGSLTNFNPVINRGFRGDAVSKISGRKSVPEGVYNKLHKLAIFKV